MKQNITIVTFAVLLFFLFTGCHFGTSGSWVNSSIDSQLRAEIKALNNELLKDITTNDAAAVKKLASSKLLEKSEKGIDTLIAKASQIITDKEYDVVDEYYTKNTAENIMNTLMPTTSDSNSYVINYMALNKEMYVSLLVPKNKTISFLVLAIYGKFDNGWKLNVIQINQYKILDKTAVDYYNEARKNYDKGYLIDAANSMYVASKISAPAADYFRYKKGDEMKAFYLKTIQEATDKYHLPLAIAQIKTKPQVFAIENQLITKGEPIGIFPIVRYKSAISVADTVALKAENKQMQEAIGGVFKGIDQNRPVIIYEAYNQIPDGKSEVRRFGMIQRLK
jgi:hypothetical protein